MNKKQRIGLFKDYHRSIDKGKGERALKQNRVLYNEIFNEYINGNANSNETKRILEKGLDKLEKDATFILEFIKLNPMGVK